MNPDFTAPGGNPSPFGRSYPSWTLWGDLAAGIHRRDHPAPQSLQQGVSPDWKPLVEGAREARPTGVHASGPRIPEVGGDRLHGDVTFEAPDFSALDVRDRVVVSLLLKHVVRMDHVAAAWKIWNERNKDGPSGSFWRALTWIPGLDHERILAEAAAASGFASVQIDGTEARNFMLELADAFSESQWQDMLDRRVLPIGRRNDRGDGKDRLLFASCDPSNPEVGRLVRGLRVHDYILCYAPESDLGTLIEGLIEEKSDAGPAAFIDRCLEEAARRGASTVHIGREGDRVRVDFRIDDELRCWEVACDSEPEAVVAAAKDAARSLDPAECDAAQEGVIRREIHGRFFRFRVSSLPISATRQNKAVESVTIHLHDEADGPSRLRRIGLPEETCRCVERRILDSRGMIVVTGLPGSARSVTIEAVLSDVAASSRRIITMEDAVETGRDGMRSVRLSAKLDHRKALEAVCAHDPDIVVAGELRTREVAELALRLANRGRLVVAKLCALDAPDAVGRLIAMGIDPILSAYAIELVVAQRLVRRLCPDCKQPARHLDGPLLRRLGFSSRQIASGAFFEEGSGCTACAGTRYAGERVLSEQLSFSHDVRRFIALSENDLEQDDLRSLAVREGMQTLRSAARGVVLEGQISVSELIRATAGEH